jgi:hypothetical protein
MPQPCNCLLTVNGFILFLCFLLVIILVFMCKDLVAFVRFLDMLQLSNTLLNFV